MTNFYNNSKSKLLFFITIFLISTFHSNILLNSNLLNFLDNKNQEEDKDFNYSDLTIEPNLNGGEEFLLFEGTESPLNITDYGNLYKHNQKVSLQDNENLNLEYYLDDQHNWKISKIENKISNIQDTRNWINNSGIEPIIVYRKYQVFESDHYPYDNNRGRLTLDNEVYEEGALYMRVHFTNISFDEQPLIEDTDYIYLYNSSVYEFFVETGFKGDFYSPWISGESIYITYSSDNSNNNEYGYYIDHYEFVNASSNTYPNEETWGFRYKKNGNWGSNNYGFGEMANKSAVYIGYYGDYTGPESADYDLGTFSEIYQNLSIFRGEIVDAYLKFDYYIEFGLETNDNYIYASINNQKVFSRGMLDAIDTGKNKWLHTGNIPMNLWLNSTRIFNTKYVKDQELNISLGIKSGGSWEYTSSEDCIINVVWFDNISLVVSTIANSSQDGINLTINTLNLFEANEWGQSYLNLTDGWDNHPIILNINSTSPSLQFDLNTTLYGYHHISTKINQQNEEGISYKILKNGTINWDFYHNFYMPPEYSEFEFIINKPTNWKIISVLDPTYMPILFEGGNIGDNYIKINETSALYPGWWKFKAISPNYISEINTVISKNNQWGYTEFYSDESAKIKTQINYSNEIPLNLDQTTVNLKVYYPNGSLWLEESKVPFSNGTVIFSEITFTSSNSVGGIYNYTLFWSNGTALGGINSNFLVIHDSYITLLEPDDAKDDNRTGGTVGDIIPLRIYLRDAENDLYISGASISYNWTTGTEYLVEIATGIYDAILDTADLGGYGLYEIVIITSKIGFLNSNFTLEINLGEESILQRLESDSKIIIHENSTIRFRYYSDFDEEGIEGALITLNISNPLYYKIQDLSNGLYSIEFNTEYFNTTGTYQLYFEFSADGFEPQIHLYRFEIIHPPQQTSQPNYLLWIFLAGAILVSAILASLSLRSYVILPRRRKKEADLLSETQRFKDIRNIQAIVIIHKLSGIPLYSKSYSILEKHKKELFSGFIQAITTIGEEFSEEGKKAEERKKLETYGTEKIIELDFKYFYCVIADLEEVRVVLVLREKSSDRLRDQVKQLLLALNLKLSEELQGWDGSLEHFETLIPPIINEYFELYYKEEFRLTLKDFNSLKMKKERNFTKLEIRVLNVIDSISNTKGNIINLDTIINLVHEDNKDLVIKAIESLIKSKIIEPINI